jgi:hypothetical protein
MKSFSLFFCQSIIESLSFKEVSCLPSEPFELRPGNVWFPLPIHFDLRYLMSRLQLTKGQHNTRERDHLFFLLLFETRSWFHSVPFNGTTAITLESCSSYRFFFISCPFFLSRCFIRSLGPPEIKPKDSTAAEMVSRRKILSRSRDDLNLETFVQDEEDVWYQKEKLFRVSD